MRLVKRGKKILVYEPCWYRLFMLVILTISGWLQANGTGDGVLLTVPYYEQGDTGWCWATCASMMLKYFGIDKEPWEIAAYFKKARDEGVGVLETDDIGRYLEIVSGFKWVVDRAKIDDGRLKRDIILALKNWNSPVMLIAPGYKKALDWLGLEHVIVIIGYSGDKDSDYVYFHDPAGLPKLTGGKICQKMTWRDFFKSPIGAELAKPKRSIIYAQRKITSSPSPLTISLLSSATGVSVIRTTPDGGGTLTIEWDGKSRHGYRYVFSGPKEVFPQNQEFGYSFTLDSRIINLDINVANSSENNLNAIVLVEIYEKPLNKLIYNEQKMLSIPPQTLYPILGFWNNRPLSSLSILKPGKYELRLSIIASTGTQSILSDSCHIQFNVETGPGISGIVAATSATVLVMDVSGSMAWQWRGGVKIESAKKAALQYIEQVANEPRQAGATHYIGVVTFSDSASVACPLTTTYDEAKKTVISLGTIASTNLGAGLDTALQELGKLPPGSKKFIILLSDGMTNTGKSRESILQTSVAEARRQGICIHTVGFGDPGDIDEDFLKKIAIQSGCGSYNYASSGFELFTTYVKVRHATLGSNRIVEYKTTTPAYFFPGQSITLGAFQLTAPAQELHYTVAWSGPVVLQAKLVDPQGRVVDTRYPNSVIYSGSGFSHVTVFSPIPGVWKAAATVKSASMQPAEYYGVASARTGGYVIPYIPPPCLVQVDNTCAIPMPDLPTVVVVAMGIAVWIWWIYNQFLK